MNTMFEKNVKKWNEHLSRRLRNWRKENGLKGIVKYLPPFLMEQDLLNKSVGNCLLSHWKILNNIQLKKRANKVWHFGNDCIFEINKPIKKSDLPKKTKDKLGTHRIPRPFVCELEDARLRGPAALGFTSDGKIISETGVALYKSILYMLTDCFFKSPLSNEDTLQLDLACSLVTHWTGYSHWILEGLTRIQGLEYYIQKTGRKPKLIIPNNPPRWMTESLKKVGYDLEECIPWSYSKARIKKLIIPSFPRNSEFIFSPEALKWLRRRIFSNLSKESNDETIYSSYIYISRRDADKRRVVNFDELMNTLASRGFDSYILSEMDFSQQVELFSEDELVVAPHGAGLTNMIWSKKNPSIIELFSERYINHLFFTLAKTLGFEYGMCECEPEGLDYRVDIKKLENIIDNLLP